MNKSKVFLLYPFCKLVKGYARNAVYDLELKKLHSISNGVYSFIIESSGKTEEEIFSLFEESGTELVNLLMNSLLDKGLIRFVEKEDYHRFLPMQQFSQPESLLDNFVIDIDNDSDYDICDALGKITIFRLQVIQIRFLYPIDYERSVQIVSKVYDTGANSIEIVIPFSTINGVENLYGLFDKYQNITNLYIWNATEYKTDEYKQCRIFFMKKSLNSNDSCGYISKNSFICNKRFYLEAQSYNTCLAKKCAIDKNGIIKNCPYMQQGFGHINNTTPEELQTIVQSAQFVHLFTIKKDDIQTCNVCDFRYGCFDCRAFLSEKGNLFSKPAKCNYNPYTAKWENEN